MNNYYETNDPKLPIAYYAFLHKQINILIKQGREEPDPAEAAAVGMEISSEQQDPDMLEKWNTAVHDLVTKLPGVTTKNQHLLLTKGQSLDHLISLSKVTNTRQAMHLYMNAPQCYSIEVHSCNHFWNGKANTYYILLCVCL
jgi:hypothetical protein